MQIVKTVVWQDDDTWLGYLQEYPDYWTQGESLDDLKLRLKELYEDLSGGTIPGSRHVEDLIITFPCSATKMIATHGEQRS